MRADLLHALPLRLAPAPQDGEKVCGMVLYIVCESCCTNHKAVLKLKYAT